MDPRLASLGRSHTLTIECLRDIERLLAHPGFDTAGDADTVRFEPNAVDWPPRYEQGRVIGRGGMGEVRRVFDRKLRRHAVMKLLAPELVRSSSARRRFENEATITAALSHPGVVPVFDCGELEDGRPWYVMQEVRGETLATLIPLIHPSDKGAWSLRRLLRIFHRLCETVAFAHSCAIIHRDLKPANMMIGNYGEVLVVDWGLAKRLGTVDEEDEVGRDAGSAGAVTQAGAVLGTPAYMAPEQARGETPLDARADTFALGVILHELVTGELPPVEPSGGAGPDSEAAFRQRLSQHGAGWQTLFALCHRSLSAERSSRPANAGQFSEALGEWLDWERRQGEGRRLVTRADTISAEITALEREAARLEREGRRLAAAHKSYAPISDKRPAWAMEAQAEALSRRAALLEVDWLTRLGTALHVGGDMPEAHERLSHYYAERLARAESARQITEAARWEALLDVHLSKTASVEMTGGTLSLSTDPPGSVVHAARYVERDRRLLPEPLGVLGVSPLDRISLPRGSYLLTLERSGSAPVRYPVRIGRSASWNGVPPGAKAARAIVLPSVGALGPDEIYVPAGWFAVGGDRFATESLPASEAWAEPFVIQRHPVTHAQFLHFLNDCVERGAADEAARHAPRLPISVAGGERLIGYVRDRDGRYALGPKTPATPWLLDSPVVHVDWFGAQAYARWYSERTGRLWRLPNELEWEKSARGVDGRLVAWGDSLEATYACMLGCRDGDPAPAPVTQYPTDESPYGVRGTVGNVRDWCGNAWRWDGPIDADGAVSLDLASDDDRELRAVRGGAWSAMPDGCRAAGRFAMAPEGRLAVVGFRLARSIAKEL